MRLLSLDRSGQAVRDRARTCSCRCEPTNHNSNGNARPASPGAALDCRSRRLASREERRDESQYGGYRAVGRTAAGMYRPRRGSRASLSLRGARRRTFCTQRGYELTRRAALLDSPVVTRLLAIARLPPDTQGLSPGCRQRPGLPRLTRRRRKSTHLGIPPTCCDRRAPAGRASSTTFGTLA